MGIQQVSELLAELGPLLDIDEIAEETDSGSWCIGLRDESLVFADYHETGHRLVLRTDVAPLPRTAGVATRLLEFNDAVNENRGIWMALDGPQGTVTQSMEILVDGLMLTGLKGDVEIFIDRLASWREVLGRFDAFEQSPVAEQVPDVRLADADGSQPENTQAIKV